MNLIHPKKHPQTILGFFSQLFTERTRSVARPHGFSNGITEWDYNEFLQEAQAYHVLGQRAYLENYLGVRQALPCAAISSVRESDGAEVFWLFQRTDQIGEEKLVGMTACFWGGHVDGVDAVFDEKSRLDLEKTLTVGRDREQGEEYRIYRVDSPHEKDWSVKFPLVPANLFIANSTVEVDKYHVAIIYNIKLPVGYAVEVLEKELIGIPVPMSAQEALDAHEAGEIKLESWAQIYMRHVRAQELLDSGKVIALEPIAEEKLLGEIRDTVYQHYRDSGVNPATGEQVSVEYNDEAFQRVHAEAAAEVNQGPSHDALLGRGGERLDNQLVLVNDGSERAAKEFVDPMLVMHRDVKASGQVVVTGPSRIGRPLSLGDICLIGEGKNAEASVAKVYLQLIADDGSKEVIGVKIERDVQVTTAMVEGETLAFGISHPTILMADTETYDYTSSRILKEVLGEKYGSIAYNFELYGVVNDVSGKLTLRCEGPHMVGFNDIDGNSYVDGQSLSQSVIESAAGLLSLKVNMLGADLVFDPI